MRLPEQRDVEWMIPSVIDVYPHPLPPVEFFMNGVPCGTTHASLAQVLLLVDGYRPDRSQSGSTWSSPLQALVTDSRLRASHVAVIRYEGRKSWLHDLHGDPYGFPKRTSLGTLWKGVAMGAIDQLGRTEYIRAAMADFSNLQYITALAELKGVDVNIQDYDGRTALHWACRMGFLETVQLCLSVPGCDLSLRDNNNLTALDIVLSGPNAVLQALFLAFSEGVVPPANLEPTTDTELDRLKLSTVFLLDGSVMHPTQNTELVSGEGTDLTHTKWIDQETLGCGSFGVVVLQQAKVGQFRAVKILHKKKENIYYSRELKALSKVTEHQDLFVQIFGWYDNANSVFIAMEYIPNGNVSQYLSNNGIPSLVDTRAITRQLLEGLIVLHGLQICHRDLKPQNVLVASLDPIQVKIADFGSSKHTKRTDLRTTVGTVGYLAPELLQLLPTAMARKTYSKAVDIWALGCMVHELLTLETPFLLADNFDSGVAALTLDDEWDDELMPETDMNALKSFCDGAAQFPTLSLVCAGVDEAAIEFVKMLLVANPEFRAAAKDALKSRWVCEPDLDN